MLRCIAFAAGGALAKPRDLDSRRSAATRRLAASGEVFMSIVGLMR